MYAKILLTTAFLLTGQVYAQTSGTTAPAKKENTKTKKKKAVPGATTTEAQTTTTTAPAVVPEPEKKSEEKTESTANMGTVQKVVKYMKEHFSASYHGEYYFVRRMDAYLGAAAPDLPAGVESDKDLQDIKYMHNPTIIYNPSKEWQFLSTFEFKHTDSVEPLAGTFVNDYFRSLFLLTRKDILTEKDHGVGLDVGIGRRDFNTRVAPGSYGNDRIFATFSKKFGKHNGSFFTQYLFNDPRTKGASQWKHGLELIPTINLQLTDKLSYLFNDDIVINSAYNDNTARDWYVTHEMNIGFVNYQWNDKISSYYQLKYYHLEDFTKNFQSKDDFFEHYIGVGYAVTPKMTVTAEVGSEIFHAHDRRSFFAKKAGYPEFALYLDAAL